MVKRAMTTEDKIIKINNSNSIDEINTPDIIPDPDNVDGYFFVYYPESLYKQAFIDIIEFTGANVHIFYDRKLEKGESYELELLQKIEEYNCIGVLLYLNTDALEDPFCLKVCRAMRKYGKRGFAVNFCKNEKGETISGATAAETIAEKLEETALALYRNMFADEITYVVGDAIFSEKLRALKGIDKPDVLEYAYGEDYAVVTGVKDIFIDTLIIPEKTEYQGKLLPVIAISGLAFANCTFLSKITFPHTLTEIGGCSIDCDRFDLTIGQTFLNCRSLRRIDLPKETCLIATKVFGGCTGLTSVSAPGLEHCAFDFLGEKSGVKSLRVSEKVKKIGNNYYCDGIYDVLELPKDIQVTGYADAIDENGVLVVGSNFDIDMCAENDELKELVIEIDEDELDQDLGIIISALLCSNLERIECQGNAYGNEVSVHIVKCDKLNTLKLPEGASSIDLSGLNNVYELKSIVIPECKEVRYTSHSRIKKMAAKIFGLIGNDDPDISYQFGEICLEAVTFESVSSLKTTNKVAVDSDYIIEDYDFNQWYNEHRSYLLQGIDEDTTIGSRRKKFNKGLITIGMGLAYIPVRIAASIAKAIRARRYKSDMKSDRDIITTKNIAAKMSHLSTIYIKETDSKIKIKRFRLTKSDKDGYAKYVRII